LSIESLDKERLFTAAAEAVRHWHVYDGLLIDVVNPVVYVLIYEYMGKN